MASGFELLGGVLNIVQILGVLSRHVQGFGKLERALKTAEASAMRTEKKIRRLDYLRTLDGLQFEILQETELEFENIREELLVIQDKVVNRSHVRKLLLAPVILEQLNQIGNRLAKKEDTLKLVGMVGALNVEHRSNIAHICRELKSRPSCSSSLTTRLEEVCQMKVVESALFDVSEQTKVCSADQMTGFVHLSAGVCLYKTEFGLKNFQLAAQYFHSALKTGWMEAYYYLRMLYKHGLGVERCDVTAMKFFEIGTNAGVAAAMSQVGSCYDEGIGVERDPEKALEFVRRGVAGDDPVGCGLLAWYSLHGQYMNTNLPLAFKMAKRASKGGFALDTLALCYEQGIGIERDPAEVFRILTEEVEEWKHWLSGLALAKCYKEGIGVKPNLEKMAAAYKKGTEYSGWKRPYYQGYYGLCLIRGVGVAENRRKGWQMIHNSIRGSNATGWYVKGECYRYGYGIEQDLNRAVQCYKRASQMENGMDGKVKAMFALGCMYELGQGGLPLNLEAAFEHFNYAANRIHQEAQWKVAFFCESGIGTDRFEDRAVHYFRLAANSGHRNAQLKASAYYMQGKGVSRNLQTAIQILTPAARNGDRDVSCDSLNYRLYSGGNGHIEQGHLN